MNNAMNLGAESSQDALSREQVWCNPFSRMQPNYKTLFIFGAGGFGREVAWLSRQLFDSEIVRYFIVDDNFSEADQVDGVPVRALSSIKHGHDSRFVVAIGGCSARRNVADRCRLAGLSATALVHPRAEMSANVRIGNGSIICAGSILTTGISLGVHVHINLACTIGHDVNIGDFSTLSPGVHVSGHVHIGRDVFIGTGANIINGSAAEPLVIGDGAVIAAGACVTRSVDPGALMAGVPAIRKR